MILAHALPVQYRQGNEENSCDNSGNLTAHLSDTRMNRFILNCIYWLCRSTGVMRLLYGMNRKYQISLTYHNVIPDEYFDDSLHLGMSIRASAFRQQVCFILSRLDVVTTNDQPGSCRITFDDGFANQAEVAAGILEEYGVRGVFYVPFKPLEDGNTLLVDRIAWWLSYVPSGRYTLCDRQIDVGTSHERSEAFSRLYDLLLKDPALWHRTVEGMEAAYPFAALDMDPELRRLRFEPITSAGLEQLKSRGHVVACHGWDHIPMASKSSADLAMELHACRTSLQQYCNSDEISYPFGGKKEVNRDVASAAGNYGFSRAYMNIDRVPESLSGLGNLALPRRSLGTTVSSLVLDARLSGLESLLKNVLNRQ